jgi:hypothetical protein
MYPAQLPWEMTETGAKVQIGQLGLLIVRKVKTDYDVCIFGKCLKNRSVTLDDGKMRAEAAARKWIADATQILWSDVEREKPMPPQTNARPGAIAKGRRSANQATGSG